MKTLPINLCVGVLLASLSANITEPGPRVCPQESRGQSAGQDVSQLQSQAAGGDPLAQLKLARAYERGEGVSENKEMAAAWYRKAAEQGNAEAQNSLGALYLVGDGVEQDKQEAVKWFHKSARQGNANAMFSLGAAYYNGDGVKIDDSLSYAWFTLAKEAGSQKGAEAVQRADSEIKARTITESFKRIAEIYEGGEYLPENQTEAARWWLKAAERGDQDAEIATALKFFNGQGVQRDFAQGRSWCDRALKEGDARGEYCIGYIYQHGLGVAADAKEARKRYERAAKGGHTLAIKALAQMYAAGEGGKVDRGEACVLYAMLAVRGDKDSLQKFAKLRKEIGEKEWREVQKRLIVQRIDRAKLEYLLQQTNTP